MASRRYAAIASVVVAGKRYAPGTGFSADPADEEVQRQLRSQAMRTLDDVEDEPPETKPARGRHKRRDMRAQA